MHGHQQPLSLEGAFQQYTRSSGSGSTLTYALPYIEFLTTFIAHGQGDIRSIADIGCGDLTIMNAVMVGLDWLRVPRPSYCGVDAIAQRVALNRQMHPELPCFVGDARNAAGAVAGDLVICKDVLQHWDTPSIHQWLEEQILEIQDPLEIYPTYILLTNCARGENVNADIVMGDWRPVDLAKPPFSLCEPLDGPGKVVFSWDTKDVVLLRSP